MKKILLITFMCTFIFCKKTTDKEDRFFEIARKERSKKGIDFNGKYKTASFEVSPNNTQNPLENVVIKNLMNSPYILNFLKEEKLLKIDANFGSVFFGDSIFKYEINENFVVLKNDTKNIKLPYTNSWGVIKLSIENHGVKEITLTPEK
jgi:hypothetical protein